MKINEEEIKNEDIEAEANRLRSQYNDYVRDKKQQPDEAQLREWAMENIIERLLVQQAALAENEDIPEGKIEGMLNIAKDKAGKKVAELDEDNVRKEARIHCQTDNYVQRIFAKITPVTNSEAKGFYQENLKQFKSPTRVRAGHIVKHVTPAVEHEAALESIETVVRKLNKGKAFESLSKQYSDCTSKGGDLGFFARGQMVPEFDTVVFNMDVGEVSNIFQTSFGYHIVKLYEIQKPKTIDFEDTKEKIMEELQRRRNNEAMNKHVDELRKQAVIEK